MAVTGPHSNVKITVFFCFRIAQTSKQTKGFGIAEGKHFRTLKNI